MSQPSKYDPSEESKKASSEEVKKDLSQEVKKDSFEEVKVDSSKEEITWQGNDLHEYALQQLLRYRESDNSFVFNLRQINNRNRLNEGFWFQGTEGYAFAGLYRAPGGNRSTNSVGLVFWESEEGYHTSFEVIYKYEERPDYLRFYQELRDLLQRNFPRQLEIISENRYRLRLEDFFSFLKEYRARIEKMVNKHRLGSIRVTEARFKRSLKRIEQIKSSPKPLASQEVEDDDDEDRAIDDTEIQAIRENFQIRLNRDIPTDSDDLNRKPFVELLYTYIRRLWRDTDNSESSRYQENSYTIHINGEWGSGKSSVLRLLQERLESDRLSPWIVVEYNAWQNQHIEDPWWVFLDKVYKTIYKKTKGPRKIWIWIRERYWRLISMNKGKVIAFLIMALISVFAFQYLAEVFGSTHSTEEVGATAVKGAQVGQKVGKSVKMQEILKVAGSIISILSSLWLLFQGFTNSLLPGNSAAAANFKQTVRDPMEEIRNHFRDILDYNKKKHIAVFIDDIDRCNPSHVVKLLEGLQTLFRTGKVLYVIAGDANWIRDSFQLQYEDLKGVITKPGQNLGNFFLEKTLQHTIELPRITKEVKKQFWNQVLTGGSAIADTDEQKLKAYEKELTQAQGDEQINAVIEKAEPELRSRLREQAALKYASSDAKRHIEHSLAKYSEFLHPNPRSMKRLANNLALEKAVNVLGGREGIREEVLILWAIFRNYYPIMANDYLRGKITLENIKEETVEGYQVIAQLDQQELRDCFL